MSSTKAKKAAKDRATRDQGAKEEGEGTLDPASYAEIYRSHVSDVVRLLRGGFRYQRQGETRFMRIESAFDVEELCQEAFSEFFRQCERGTFDASRPVRPYLLRIAANRAARRMGRVHSEVLLPEEDLPLEAADPPDTDAAERRALLAEFRATLSAEENEVIDHCFLEGASQKQAGEAIGLSRDQVYRLIQKIRRSAREFFGARGWFDEA